MGLFNTVRPAIALALLRITAGVIFFAHGYQKAFTWGVPSVSASFGQMGIPMPNVVAAGVTTLELAGGLALILGFYYRPIALLFVCDMLGAIFFVHRKGGFFVPGGMEFVTILGMAALTVALAGGGAGTADELIARRKSK